MGDRMNIVTLAKAWWNEKLVVIDLPEIDLCSGMVHLSEYLPDIEAELISGGRADSQDAYFQLVNPEWFTEGIHQKYVTWQKGNGLDMKYDERVFDCDDFALGFWYWCRMLYSRQPGTQASSPFIGYCKSQTMGHVFNFVVTSDGPRYYEPQTGKWLNNVDGIYWMQF